MQEIMWTPSGRHLLTRSFFIVSSDECIPGVSEFLLLLDVVVCVEVSLQLPLVQLVDLVLFQNK